MSEDKTTVDSPESEPEIRQEKAPLSERSITYAVAVLVITLDLATKLIVENSLAINERYVPFEAIASVFQITRVSNTGAAFGIFPAASQVITVIAIVVSLFIIVYNRRLPTNHSLYRVALGLQLGGALGNLLSRVRIGHVTDFFDFGPWPVFNIADLSIVLGVILLGYLMLFDQPQEDSQDPEELPIEEAPEPQQVDSSEDEPMLWNE